ncbi:hypothetical protein LCGC14_1317260 [marine sediment metagenome]|uniref:DUF669 domain-containing protein n=1 Tax=marine sediment metagenome TaxID=412755 RepID=A0A0F9N1D1_9ZZZZ
MAIKINMAGVQEGEFDAMPDGLYPCRLFDMNVKNSKDGKPYIEWVFKVQEGHSNAGRQFWMNNSLQQQALWALKRTLIALGDDPADLDGELELEKEDYVGRECVVSVVAETYEGVVRNKVKRVLPTGAEEAEAEVGNVDDL